MMPRQPVHRVVRILIPSHVTQTSELHFLIVKTLNRTGSPTTSLPENNIRDVPFLRHQSSTLEESSDKMKLVKEEI